MGRLPSAATLDAQSEVLCRFHPDLPPVLRSFQNCAIVRAGAHRLVNGTSDDEVRGTLTATAESCVRRTLQDQQERFAKEFGDPVDADGVVAPLLAIAVGDFGGYKIEVGDPLGIAWVFDATGQTRRRSGGSRLTMPAAQFFDRLAAAVVERLRDAPQSADGSGPGPLYEIDSPPMFKRESEAGEPATFFAMEWNRLASLLQNAAKGVELRRLMATARCINGPPHTRRRVDRLVRHLSID